MRITYYFEVISSWCYWAEPAWSELQRRYAGRIEFQWRLALLDASGLPTSRDQCDWFYRRSGTIVRSPFMLNSGWYEPELAEYLAPNLVAEAARDFGVHDDRVRLALAHAALREGHKVGRWEIAAAAGAAAVGLDPVQLLDAARSPAVEARARASTAEFHSLKIRQRPTFVIESDIGDRTVFSGVWKLDPLVAALEAMFEDSAAYTSYRAHHGTSQSP